MENQNVIPVDNAIESSASVENIESNSALEKVLKEKRNWAAKAKELELKLKQAEEAKLVEKEEYKTLSERLREENQKLASDLSNQKKMITDSLKLGALKKELAKLGMQSSYMDKVTKFVDLNSIHVDADTSTVTGHDSAAKMIQEEFSPLFAGAQVKADHGAVNASNAPNKIDINKLTTEQRRAAINEALRTLAPK